MGFTTRVYSTVLNYILMLKYRWKIDTDLEVLSSLSIYSDIYLSFTQLKI